MYSREKTLAVLTALVTIALFFGGTCIAVYYNFSYANLPLWPALASLGGLIIMDLVMIFAAWIDYHEDDNIQEWVAWVVKGIASISVIVIAGLMFARMATISETSATNQTAIDRAQKALQDCRAQNMTSNACQKVYDATLKSANTGIEVNKETQATKSRIFEYTENPFFPYLPGIIGLTCFLLLGAVSKFGTREKDNHAVAYLTEEYIHQTASTLPTKRKSTFFRFRQQGDKWVLTARSNGKEKYIKMVTPEEYARLNTLTDGQLRDEAITLASKPETKNFLRKMKV